MIKDKDRIIDDKQQKNEENIGVLIKENIKQHENGTAIVVNRQIREGRTRSLSEARKTREGVARADS